MDMLLIFLIIVVGKNNLLNVPLIGLYVSFLETILKLCMVHKFSSCKISLNFEIIFSLITTFCGVEVSYAIYLKVKIGLKLKILNKFNQYKMCLK